jgi:hypothetical protein
MSEAGPSVKGSIFVSVANDVRKALDEGRLERADFEAGLEDKDLDYFESDAVTAVSWMPMPTYGRMLELLAKVEGGSGREAYLRDRGAHAAERLLSSTYQRFEAKPGEWGPKSGELMVGIAGTLYNFTQWRFGEVEPGEWEIEAREAEPFPDAAAHTAHGFLDWYANRASPTPIDTQLLRPSPDRIVFRLRERG